VAVFLHGIPLVDHDNTGAPVFLNATGEPLILLCDAIEGINHQHTDITAFNRFEAAVDAKEFGAVIDTATAADACGIDETPGPVLAHKTGVDRVTGRPADWADDGPLLTADGIQQARFAHIRATDDGELNRLFAVILLRLRWQVGENLIQQFRGSSPVNRRNGVRLSKAKTPELGCHRQSLLRRLAFVDCEKRRTALAAQKFCDGLIRRCHPQLTIHNHQGDAGFFQGKSCLFADLRQELAVVVKDQATGVHHLEFPVTPVTVLIGAVTGHTGLVMHDCFPAVTEAIHQRGLANVGAPDNRDNGTRQIRQKQTMS